MALTLDIQQWPDPAQVDVDCCLEATGLLECLSRMDYAAGTRLLALKGETVTLLASQPVAQIVQPPFGIWYMQESGTLVIGIRGTTVPGQWLPHIAGTWAQRWPEPPHPQAGYAHSGMVYGSRLVWPIVEGILTVGPDPNRIVLVGHSYGGGVAAVLFYLLMIGGHIAKLRVMTLGAPRVFTGTPFVDGQDAVYWRLQHGGDQIPSMPPPWANLRGLITGQGIKRVIGTLGGGPILGLVGPQLVQEGATIPPWKHWGHGLQLQRDGSLAFADPPEDSAPKATRPSSITGVGVNHLLDTSYWPSLKQTALIRRRGEVTTDRIIALVQGVLETPAVVESDAGWDEADEGQRAAVTAAWVLSQDVTVSDLRTSEGASVTIAPPMPPASIGARLESGGGSMATWRYTAYISWGAYGRTVSIHKTGPGTFAAAQQDCLLWINQLSSLFGNLPGPYPKEGQFNIGTPGRPVIEYARVSDPIVPRQSIRFRVPGDDGSAELTTNPNVGADMPWVGVSLSTLAQGGGNTIRDTVSVLGQPDEVASDGGFNGNAAMPDGLTFLAQFNLYLQYILPPAGVGFGCMGRDLANAPNVPVTNWAVGPSGEMTVRADTSNWQTNEYVRIIASKVPYYNREWRISLNDDDSYTLLGSRPAGYDVPSTATGYRTRLANGNKQQIFYAYIEAASSVNPLFRAFITKRNPARRFSPLVSRRRRRTPPK